jgi:hypothetical protein
VVIDCRVPFEQRPAARKARNAGRMSAGHFVWWLETRERKVTKPLTGRAGLPREAAIVTGTNLNPLAVSSCTVWLKEAAFFGDFLCSRKESYPPAGEAVTE